jgi:tRNA G18 (ribose-2'-O)-methylase SpoU
MPPVLIPSLDDPRVAPYRAMKDRELARAGDLFIAEGESVVRRLLRSDFPVHSVFLSDRRAEEFAPYVPAGVDVYVAPHALLQEILGFKFHNGVIACGRRKPERHLDDVVTPAGPLLLVICPEVANTENLGSLIRIAAAFGADAMLLGERCCDPFFRQSIRVSMGTAFSLPIVRSTDLLADLRQLRGRWGVQLAATVLDEGAEALGGARRPERFGLLFGNEAQGLDAAHVAACDRRVTIPMQLGTDSLNVAVSAAVFLYHFTRPDSLARSTPRGL